MVQMIETKFRFQKLRLGTEQIKITCDQKDWIYFPLNDTTWSGFPAKSNASSVACVPRFHQIS